ncbi:SusD/RagB family nutrient-binding outer membrane lipoprotein [Fulvivirga lutimaris]|uniref:SusD/RagB family nutrient-binding outer membrane lipoprotein n=1 Tax=Fulvivirga lutimaris TaxID=1819566 RepID=UPI0012BCCBAE|nr:SusD/RagB family nutrient-binding outer membrane lipoprotein [Fulvivirga lutimaris]MTI40275.1 SusD/RagB family nutrient-binding outer membrane lipoprotein [Fulvivirga lutimaris]
MKNIIIKKIFALAVIFSMVTACDFGDTNVDPSVPTDVSMSALLPSGEAAVSWAVGGEIVRISGLLTQQFEGINAQQADNYRYLIRDADMNGVWQRMYFNSLNTINTIIKKADENDAPHYKGVAQVLMATGIGTLADAFGDVPYSTAFQADQGNFNPTYDTQQELYNTTIPNLLDDAIANLSASESLGGSPSGDDLIFGGDLDAWISAANSLKMRYTFQAAKQNASAYDDALALLPEVIASNGEDFEMYFGNGANETNPQFQFSQSRAGNIKMGDYFTNVFSADDPRGELFLDGSLFETGSADSPSYYASSNSPVVLMSYVEVKFIEAEAELMRNASDEAAAKAALDAAVNASFLKISGAGVPATYQADLDARWAAAATANDKLAVIIDEKYIGCFSQGLIAWNDYRRTGFPALTIVTGGTNAFNANGEIPRRLPYPQEERLLNLSNLPIQTPNLQTRFWWDQ